MLPARFWDKILIGDGCWEWTAYIGNRGYGEFDASYGNSSMAHRLVCEAHNGPVPAGYEVDHLCRNRRCVRPSHLEAVPPRINRLRQPLVGFALATADYWLDAETCPRGHLWTEANTYIEPNGKRRCRTCKAARQRFHRAGRAGTVEDYVASI